MSKFNTVRTGLLGSAAALALLGTATTAQAVEAQFGDIQIFFDTTVSMGASMRMAPRMSEFLPESNGGNVDPRINGILVDVDGPGAYSTANGFVGSGTVLPGLSPVGTLLVTNNPNNFDGSVNGDDGRLNFNRGDFIGANVKANHDLVVKWQNYTLFARAVGFYDVILNDKNAGERSQLTDQALGDVGRNYELLDLFVSADYTLSGMPLNVRVGKQVINWGESTFIQNGNNVFSPVDVGAIRRPGAEIKEALLPVNAISASITLPFEVSLSGYYALDWEPFEIDPGGTPFAGADFAALGSGLGGNEGAVAFTSGSPFGGMRRNCKDNNPFVALSQETNAVIKGILPSRVGALGDGILQCSDESALTGIFASMINYQNPYALGRYEEVKIGLPGLLTAEGFTRPMQGIIEKRGYLEPTSNYGDFGISAKYLFEELDGTEFGVYYQNYTSRLPIFNVVRLGRPHVGFSTVGDGTGLSGLSNAGVTPVGCGLTPGMIEAVAAATINGAAAAVPDTVNVDDPMNLVNAGVNAAVFANSGFAGFLALNGSGTLDHARNVFKVNCMAQYYQNVALGPNLLVAGGSEGIGLNPQYGHRFEYPEDIDVFGVSFNTVIGGIGVQGEMSYRPEAPFQVDGDTLTIWNAVSDCVIRTAAGGVEALFAPLTTADGTGAPSCGNTRVSNPIIKNEMYTAQIGTTSTLTGSNWFLEAIGSEGAVVVTEVGIVHVSNVEASYLNGSANKTLVQYQSLSCQGSDLGLGALIGSDPKPSAQCRPNDLSAGLVVLARLDYNNVFNTGFLLQPSISYSWDFYGSTPSPYSNYLEDRQSVNLGVTGTLNNNLRVGASYTNFFSGDISNKSRDQDFASMTASYTF